MDEDDPDAGSLESGCSALAMAPVYPTVARSGAAHLSGSPLPGSPLPGSPCTIRPA